MHVGGNVSTNRNNKESKRKTKLVKSAKQEKPSLLKGRLGKKKKQKKTGIRNFVINHQCRRLHVTRKKGFSKTSTKHTEGGEYMSRNEAE